MLINEFDLNLSEKDEFLKNDQSEKKFYWLQAREYIKIQGHEHLVLLMLRNRKGRYKIMPNFDLVIK